MAASASSFPPSSFFVSAYRAQVDIASPGREPGSDAERFLGDALGSITEVTDESGAVVERYQYDVYGAVTIYDGSWVTLTASAIGNPYLFTGRRFDPESGNYYYRARYYSPSLGRFLSQDPIGYAAGDANLYRYVLNRPTNLADPSGKADWYYSTPYGWFDPSHIRTGNPQKIIGDVRKAVERGGDYVRVRQPLGYFPSVFYYEATYWVEETVCEEQVEAVALGIYVDWSVRFELWEGSFPVVGANTSFAIEDLPSHYLGFYAVATEIPEEKIMEQHFGGFTKVTDTEPPRSRMVFEDRKNVLFQPKIQDEAGNWVYTRWPDEMQRMLDNLVPGDSGLWHFHSERDGFWYQVGKLVPDNWLTTEYSGVPGKGV